MGAFWFLLVGALLVAVALLGRWIDRLPVSLALIYLLAGFALGPAVFDVIELDPMRHPGLLEAITEVVLLIALFTVGVKLRVPLGDWRWSLPLRLASVTMLLTIAGIAAAGHWLLGLPPGVALLLGACLAPTDPVLASDVQLRGPADRDTLRFALTGEGGLNDGTAFPFVLLALGVLGVRDLGPHGWHWAGVDLLWSVVGGPAIGFVIGTAVARGVRGLHAWRRDAVRFDEFLLLGVIGLSYGAALLAHTLGFLSVFAAGLALRRADDIRAGSPGDADELPLTPSMLNVNEQLERILEVAVVLLVGAMISTGYWSRGGLLLALLLIGVIRPLAVWLGVLGDPASRTQRRLVAWFGIRGIGSVYYAIFAVRHGLRQDAPELLACVMTVVAASIVVHGVSATPLMELYQRRRAHPRRDRRLSDKR